MMNYNNFTDESLYVLDEQEQEQIKQFWGSKYSVYKKYFFIAFKDFMKESSAVKRGKKKDFKTTKEQMLLIDIPKMNLDDNYKKKEKWKKVDELAEAGNRIIGKLEKGKKRNPEIKKSFSKYILEMEFIMDFFYSYIEERKPEEQDLLVLKSIEYFLWKEPYTTNGAGSPLTFFAGVLTETYVRGLMETIFGKCISGKPKDKKDNDNGIDIVIHLKNKKEFYIDVKTRKKNSPFSPKSNVYFKDFYKADTFIPADNGVMSLRDYQLNKDDNKTNCIASTWINFKDGYITLLGFYDYASVKQKMMPLLKKEALEIKMKTNKKYIKKEIPTVYKRAWNRGTVTCIFQPYLNGEIEVYNFSALPTKDAEKMRLYQGYIPL